MKAKFNYEYEDESGSSSISFEYDDFIEEKLSVKLENGVPVVYANRTAFKLLAKTFIKLADGNYRDGFHIHMNTDFDADNEEAVRLVICE